MEDNWNYGDRDAQLHKKAVLFLEKNREKLSRKPVKYVPQGFSYDIEKLKKKKSNNINN